MHLIHLTVIENLLFKTYKKQIICLYLILNRSCVNIIIQIFLQKSLKNYMLICFYENKNI